MQCPNCGGENEPAATRCSYCESPLQSPAAAGDRAGRFAAVRASPEFARRDSPERLALLPKTSPLQQAFTIGFFVIFIGGSATIAMGAVGMAGGIGFAGPGGPARAFAIAPLMFAIVPIGFVAVGIYMLRRTIRRFRTFANDPVEALAVIVVDKRTEVSGGGETSAHTSYFATCEGEDGEREELPLWDGRLYGKMAPGDAGVLFKRAGYALAFDRVETAGQAGGGPRR